MYSYEQGGAVEACWAHNPDVSGSKPLPANAITPRENTSWMPKKLFSLGFFQNLKFKQKLCESHHLLSWPNWLVRRTYKQCWSICEGRGFDPFREQVLKFSNRYFLNKHWILALAKIYYILPFKFPSF